MTSVHGSILMRVYGRGCQSSGSRRITRGPTPQVSALVRPCCVTSRYVRRLTSAPSMTRTPPAPDADSRRWFAAAVVILSVLIPVLDNTILYVAIPKILADFDTELTSLQW